jgi:hypothetical protein
LVFRNLCRAGLDTLRVGADRVLCVCQRCRCGAAGIGLGATPGFFAASASHLLTPSSTTPRSCGRRHRPWHHDQVPATHHERRREKRPEYHGQVALELNAGAGNNWAKANIYKSWARFLLTPPPYSVVAFVVNSEPHTGRRSSARLWGPSFLAVFIKQIARTNEATGRFVLSPYSAQKHPKFWCALLI